MLAWQTTVLAALSILQFAPAVCQPPRSRSGRIPFFDALRKAHDQNPNKDILDLLHHPPIRKEIGLDEEEFEGIRKEMGTGMKLIWDLADRSHHERGTEKGHGTDELCDKIIEQLLPLEKTVFRLLEENANLDRLIEILVQHRNYSSAVSDHVAKQIGLEGDALQQFRKDRSDLRRKSMHETRREIERMVRNPNPNLRQQIGDLFQKAQAKLDSALGDKLTPTQKEKLETLKGEPFIDLPPRGPPHRSRRFGGKENPGGPKRTGGKPGPPREREPGRRAPPRNNPPPK